eukprot:jgi/Botrbrau1/12367/Bobra.0239s0016.1
MYKGLKHVTAPTDLAASPRVRIGRPSPKLKQRHIVLMSTSAGSSTKAGDASATETRNSYTLKAEAGGTYNTFSLAITTATAGSFLTFAAGAFVSPNLASYKNNPKEPIILYEFQGCPYCRKVREVASILDIDVLFRPCPKGGPTWRPEATKLSGKSQFPYLIDPNQNNKAMLESDDIIKYLCNQYGDGKVPWQVSLGPITVLGAGLAAAARGGKGVYYRRSRLPDQPLHIWGYEPSPYVTLVREVLNDLEIPHVYHNVSRGSPKRKILTDKWNTAFQVPYLEDPNTKIAMFESAQIIKYLEDSYALK